MDFLSKKFLRADNGDERHTRKDGSEYERKCISKKGGGETGVYNRLFFFRRPKFFGRRLLFILNYIIAFPPAQILPVGKTCI